MNPRKPRPWENRDLRAEYAAANPTCELTELLKRIGVSVARYELGLPDQVHHIVGRTHGTYDVVSNLITVSAAVHAWIHDNQRQGRVLCLWLKAKKGELDAAELNAAWGAVRPDANPVGAWLTSDETVAACVRSNVLREMRMRVVDEIERQRKGE